MITLKVQLIIGAALLVAFIIITNMIRRKSLELKYALSWLIVVVALFILDFFPKTMDTMADFLGIGAPVNMMFFLGFCFSLAIIFSLTVALSRISARVRKLAQTAALDKKVIQELTDKLEWLEQQGKPADILLPDDENKDKERTNS